MERIKRLFQDESGATAIEYGLIASLVSVAIIASLVLLGPKLNGVFDYIQGKLTP